MREIGVPSLRQSGKKWGIVVMMIIYACTLSACQDEEEVTVEESFDVQREDLPFPFNLVHAQFDLPPFEIPDGWEVFQVTQFYAYATETDEIEQKQNADDSIPIEWEDYLDLENFPERDDDAAPPLQAVPSFVSFSFGVVAGEDQYDLEQVQQSEQKVKSQSETLYRVSAEKRYAGLRTMRTVNAEEVLSYKLEHTDMTQETLEVEGTKVIALYRGEDDSPHEYSWVSDDNRFLYELIIESGPRDIHLNESERQLSNMESVLETLVGQQ